VNGFRILHPQVTGGQRPGYVEAEFQLYPFIVALFYSRFGETSVAGPTGVVHLFDTDDNRLFLVRPKSAEAASGTLSLILFISRHCSTASVRPLCRKPP